MFNDICTEIRESVYGIMGVTSEEVGKNKHKISVTNATGFMVAPGYIVTAAHFIHVDNDPKKAVHQSFEVIRAPDIGNNMEKASFVAEDSARDIALLKIESPKSSKSVELTDSVIAKGSQCGFLGFPLANVQFMQDGKRQFNLIERFQGSYISSYYEIKDQLGRVLPVYEIDSLMYSGSSGCPGFTIEGKILGMQVASVNQNNSEGKAERVAISIVVPSTDILNFLKANKIK